MNPKCPVLFNGKRRKLPIILVKEWNQLEFMSKLQQKRPFRLFGIHLVYNL